MHGGTRQTSIRQGFTLVELMIAVALMAVIILVIGYIFQTTTRAISLNQANAEMRVSLASFEDRFRNDLRGLEIGGHLVFGRRESEGYGSVADRADELKITMRKDWLLLSNSSEQQGALNEKAIGLFQRILYGHGEVSDSTGSGFNIGGSRHYMVDHEHSNFSELGTDWILQRSQVIEMSQNRFGVGGTSDVDEQGDSAGQYGTGWNFDRALVSYVNRDFRWLDYNHANWRGTVIVNYGTDRGVGSMGKRAIFEPAYYHFGSNSNISPEKLHVLGHCGHFRVQYAMPQDLTAGAGGTIAWRDGPLWHDPRRDDAPPSGLGDYPDPNYSAGDPAHPNPYIPVGEVGTPYHPTDDSYVGSNQYSLVPDVHRYAGRIAFAPGDIWPSLLKITVHVYDPRGRIRGPVANEIIIPLR